MWLSVGEIAKTLRLRDELRRVFQEAEMQRITRTGKPDVKRPTPKPKTVTKGA